MLVESSEYVAQNVSGKSIVFDIPVYASRVEKKSYSAKCFKKEGNDWVEKISSCEFSRIGEAFECQDSVQINLRDQEEFKVEVNQTLQKDVSDSHLWTNLVNSEEFILHVVNSGGKLNIGGRLASAVNNDVRQPPTIDEEFTLRHSTAFLSGNSSYLFWNPVEKQ